jgi:hypothetical protein
MLVLVLIRVAASKQAYPFCLFLKLKVLFKKDDPIFAAVCYRLSYIACYIVRPF